MNLDWLQAILEKKYELKTQRIGGSSGTAREGKILNRVVRYTKGGFEYEADPRQGEAIVEAMEVNGKGVATLGIEGREDEESGTDRIYSSQ